MVTSKKKKNSLLSFSREVLQKSQNKNKLNEKCYCFTKLPKFSKLVSSPYIGTFGLRLLTFSPPLNDSGCLLPFTPIADLASHYPHHFIRHHHYHLPHCSDSFPARSHLQFLSKQALGRESNNSLFSKFFNRRWPSGRKPKLPGKRTASFNRNQHPAALWVYPRIYAILIVWCMQERETNMSQFQGLVRI